LPRTGNDIAAQIDAVPGFTTLGIAIGAKGGQEIVYHLAESSANVT
jgi:hypothetical protein